MVERAVHVYTLLSSHAYSRLEQGRVGINLHRDISV